MQPRSAYIHVPFCSHRCGYCNFTLIAGRDDLIDAYLQALVLELQRTLVEPQPVDTLFLGGGTPTHLSTAQLERLLTSITTWLKPTRDCEFSCEANPLDCTLLHLQALRTGGVNRLSLGGQSFSDRKLRVLERDHSGDVLLATLDRAAEYFSNISLDLIFAAPEESQFEWQADIAIAARTPIQHLSTYGLTIERGSAFYGRALRSNLAELDEEQQLSMYEHAIDALTAQGWQHYEVSSFAKPDYACRHNQTYWRGAAWWAFGPGAASFLPDADGAMVRAVNHQSTTNYLKRVLGGESAIGESVTLSIEQQIRERLVFGLRQLAGLSLQELGNEFGGEIRSLFEPHLSDFVRRGFLHEQDGQVRLTRRGLFISDSLWPKLLCS
ncbi:MAG: radical SAM family heme chaperone HemW [Pirellulaceae bacterium]